MTITVSETTEKHFLSVSKVKEGPYQFLCTYLLDGKPQLLYHSIKPLEDKEEVENYLYQLDGSVTDTWYWQLLPYEQLQHLEL